MSHIIGPYINTPTQAVIRKLILPNQFGEELGLMGL